MCLAIPGRVVAIDTAGSTATVDFEGLRKTASLLYVPEARVGDYVIVQSGFAIRQVPEPEATEALRLARETSVDGAAMPRAGSVPSAEA